jgi:hypothetical protein
MRFSRLTAGISEPSLGQTVYDLRVLTPGEFLGAERQAGRLHA